MTRPVATLAALAGALALAGAWLALRPSGRSALEGGAEATDDPTPSGAPDLAAREEREAARLRVGHEDDARGGSVRLRLVDGDTRFPVAGALVSLAGESEAGRKERRGGATDERGTAVLEHVPAGTAYLVRVSPPEGRAIERREVAVEDDGVTDLGTLYTGAHGRIEGVVVDEQGKGVPKATVQGSMGPATLASDDGDAFPTRPFPDVLTAVECDETGAFTMEEVPVGMIALRAAKPGYRPSIDRAVLEPGGRPLPVRLLLTRGASVLGRVEERDGRPVPGALVEVGPLPRGRFGGDFEARERATTDETGAFEIAGFGDGKLRVAVRVTPGDRTPTFFPWPPAIDRPLRLVLDGGASVSVRVANDATDEPVGDARVRLLPDPRFDSASSGAGPREIHGTTDARGLAVLTVSPGDVPALAVSAKGYLEGTAGGRDPARRLRLEGALGTIKPGESRPLRLWIRRGPMVVGRVTDDAGKTVPRARVWLDYDGTRARVVETDGAGEYLISDAEMARHPSVVARSPGGRLGARVPLDRKAHDDDLVVRVDLGLTEAGAQDAPRPRRGGSLSDRWCSVRGRTVDVGMRPLGDVLVDVWGDKPLRSDAAGTFFVQNALILFPRSPRTPYVRGVFALDGYVPTICEWPAAEGDLLEPPDVVMGFGATIRGRVRGPEGFSGAGGGVSLEGQGDGPRRTTIVAADGTFEVRALPALEFRVHARGPGWVAVPAAVRAEEHAPETVLRVVPLLEWEGRVVDPTGAALAGVTLSLDRSAREDTTVDPLAERTQAQTGPDGGFRLAVTGRAPTVLWVRAPGRMTRVEMPAAGTGIRLVVER